MISLVLDNSTFANIRASVFPSTPELQSKPLRVIFPNANPDVQKSISIAESLAVEHLHHISKIAFPVTVQISLDFGDQAGTDFNGQSAGIAFFLALTEKICHTDFGAVVATGALNPDG